MLNKARAAAAAAAGSLQSVGRKPKGLKNSSYHPPASLSHGGDDSYTHIAKRAETKEDDCSQPATGLAVLSKNPGASALLCHPFTPFACLPQPASLWGCPCVAPHLFRAHKHTDAHADVRRALYPVPLSEKEGSALCSNSLM